MNTKTLFGLSENEFQSTCMILPVGLKALLKGFGINKLTDNVPFPSANCEKCTVIIGKVGAAFVGDIVLALEQTSCKNIILLGACGILEETPVLRFGSLVVPSLSYDLESFSIMLGGPLDNVPNFTKASTAMFKAFTAAHPQIPEVKCATVGSILLENRYLQFFKKHKIETVDMECSAFFNAGRKTKKNIIALFFVTDIVGKANGYILWNEEQKKLISQACVNAVNLVKNFTY
ncbi:MAG: hypothetical protein HQL26_09850 [Candidatus Omnitrophica bacterium]|nr:hypothetical protein [Candidatus Omnitrophota bacterium]